MYILTWFTPESDEGLCFLAGLTVIPICIVKCQGLGSVIIGRPFCVSPQAFASALILVWKVWPIIYIKIAQAIIPFEEVRGNVMIIQQVSNQNKLAACQLQWWILFIYFVWCLSVDVLSLCTMWCLLLLIVFEWLTTELGLFTIFLYQ